MLSTHQLSSSIVKALQTASESHLGTAWSLKLQPASLDEQPSTLPPAECSVELLVEGALEGKLYFAFNAAALQYAFGGAAPASSEGLTSACLAFCQSAMPVLSQALGTDAAQPVIQNCRVANAASGAVAFAHLELTSASGAVITLFGDANLCAKLLPDAADADRVSSSELASQENQPDRAHLERVIDVPLAVTLRFGQRQLALRDVLALTTGSLLELDHQVEEPVHLMLGDRVIARGEVVIVDGAYGMRVTEVVENRPSRLALRG